ncbi:glycosyl transferase family protein [Thauera sp. 27]|uniref:glycosyltransferase n=1 Tax=Thauera sp. 27 TaxID=305700 RepID=UPI0002CEB2AD|nr:glycosyltransferase [Thauera sp. 27]ENO77389.1 glycosyl transferase family protein [Thauera sp. 27]
MAINYLVFPYRSYFFKKNYGVSVRDLQIIEVLKRRNDTGKLLIVDRPLTVYEASLGRITHEDNYIKHISLDLIGPLKGRRWTEECYTELKPKLLSSISSWDNVVILDFTPIANIHTIKIPHNFYWYDLIDNFAIHNRFTEIEKELVRKKYKKTSSHADIITGVTDQALSSFPQGKKHTITNGLYDVGNCLTNSEPEFKYGFLGFLTDKFDLAFIEQLAASDPNFSLVIYGDSYDKLLVRTLLRTPGVTLKGRFKKDDIPNLMSTFEVGLIPYLRSKSHDGSPLKLYEYLHYGKPVLTSIDYEITGDSIINYNHEGIENTISRLKDLLNDPRCSQHTKAMLRNEDYLESKIEPVISKIRSSLEIL